MANTREKIYRPALEPYFREIRATLEFTAMTQGTLAARLGVSGESLSQWLAYKRIPRERRLVQLGQKMQEILESDPILRRQLDAVFAGMEEEAASE